MKTLFNISLFFLFVLYGSLVYSQKINIFKNEKMNLGLYISPVYELSRINSTNTSFIGIGIGILGKDFDIGFLIQKINSTIIHDMPDLENSRLKFEIYGGEINYNKYFYLFKNIYYSVGISLGNNYVQLRHIGTASGIASNPPGCFEKTFVSDTYYTIKPKIKLFYKLNNSLIINIGIGYRIVGDLKMDYITNPQAINFQNHDFNDFFISSSIKYFFLIK